MSKKEKKTSYPLMIILNTVSIALPFAGAGFLLYTYLQESLKQYRTIAAIACVIAIGQWLILRNFLNHKLHEAVQENEYDEFGMSKKKKFENLTRQEREAMDLQKVAQMESLLSSSVLKKITKKGSDNPDKDLAGLIGIHAVKEKTSEMVARMQFEQASAKEKKKKRKRGNMSGSAMSGRHMVFYGSAGVGKTTVARIITGFLYKYGYIKENKCIEIDGNFLKAGEDSATKTRLIIQKAYGGVLFIDEAYTIVDGSGGYGKEVVATLIKEMEDNRDRLIVILAGYKNDMKRLLDSNEGFKSRIKEYLNFPDYSTPEMKDIFSAMAHSEGYMVSQEALDNFEIRCDKERKLSSFGNGRTARNILDESIDRHAVNYGQNQLVRTVTENGEPKQITDRAENRFVLCGCDVSTAVNRNIL